jgi:phosphate:Na+ symporter
MARAINRKFRSSDDFTEEQYNRIKHIMQLCDKALTNMIDVISDAVTADANRTLNMENEINDYRKLLKEKNIADIENQKYSYQMGVHYMDVVNDCEKLGDYVVNVVEAHTNKKFST